MKNSITLRLSIAYIIIALIYIFIIYPFRIDFYNIGSFLLSIAFIIILIMTYQMYNNYDYYYKLFNIYILLVIPAYFITSISSDFRVITTWFIISVVVTLVFYPYRAKSIKNTAKIIECNDDTRKYYRNINIFFVVIAMLQTRALYGRLMTFQEDRAGGTISTETFLYIVCFLIISTIVFLIIKKEKWPSKVPFNERKSFWSLLILFILYTIFDSLTLSQSNLYQVRGNNPLEIVIPYVLIIFLILYRFKQLNRRYGYREYYYQFTFSILLLSAVVYSVASCYFVREISFPMLLLTIGIYIIYIISAMIRCYNHTITKPSIPSLIISIIGIIFYIVYINEYIENIIKTGVFG